MNAEVGTLSFMHAGADRHKLETALGALVAGAGAGVSAGAGAGVGAGATAPAASPPDTSPQGTPRGRLRMPRPSSPGPALGASRNKAPAVGGSFKR